MSKPIPETWRLAAGHFSTVLRRLADHRGFEAEQELISIIGEPRLKALYAGEEPKLGEMIEAARVFGVSLSTFQIHEPGAFPELELGYAELLHAAAQMSPGERQRLIEALFELPARVRSSGARPDQAAPPLPESLLAVLKRAPD